MKEGTSTSGRVLFVDDDPLCAKAFARVLRRRGFSVDVATNATDALSLAKQFHYAVVATDLVMPDVNGVGLIREIRGLQPDAAYVMVTGAVDLELPKNEDADSISQIVFKPWNDEVLFEAIFRAINLHTEQIADRFVAMATGDSRDEAQVLLIEDDPADQMRVARAVSRTSHGQYAIEVVTRLADALDRLDKKAYDLILVDLSLPDARGLTSVAMVQAAAPNVPMLVLSGTNAEALAYQSVQIGAEDYLDKSRIDDIGLVRAMRFAIERARARERIAHLASFHPLTGLPNSASFRQRLQELLTLRASTDATVGVVVFDLDRFRTVNELYGYDTGDQLIRELGERLRRVARPNEIIAHLEGDEFGLIADTVADTGDLEEITQRIRDTVARPISFEGREVMATASVGAALSGDSKDADALIRDAHEALADAKRAGRGHAVIHEHEHATRDLFRLSLEGDLGGALERGEFEAYYQPKIDLSSNAIVGFEALIRWNHPDRGLVSPGAFISLLEETGLIVPVGAWILDEAVHQLVAWQREFDRPDLTMAINVSERQIQEPKLIEHVWRALGGNGATPATVELELTEGALIDGRHAMDMLQALSDLDVSLAIDDFGTGYSSLAYLERLPIDVVKIDRAFVSRLTPGGSSNSITAAIVAMAKALELGVVGEGVETDEQAAILEGLGCRVAQGYRFAKPMPASMCEAWIRTRGLPPDLTDTPPTQSAYEPVVSTESTAATVALGTRPA